jgi:hypothetical protein
MPISVSVRDYLDRRIAESTSLDFEAFCGLASPIDHPFIGNIDPYDDTVFNQHQSMRLRLEVVNLLSLGQSAGQDAGRWLLEMCKLLDAKPHRYLIFSGD